MKKRIQTATTVDEPVSAFKDESVTVCSCDFISDSYLFMIGLNAEMLPMLRYVCVEREHFHC